MLQLKFTNGKMIPYEGVETLDGMFILELICYLDLFSLFDL